MSTCPDASELLNFISGALEEQEQRAMEAHLDGCLVCRQTVSEMGKDTLPNEVPSRGTNPLWLLGRGSLVGRYVILDRIGGGGMGVVYAAYDPQLNRKIALKCLRTEGGAADEEKRRNRMLLEAQAMARLSHPNVVAVYDVGLYQNQIFIAMELVEGLTLAGWLNQRKHGWREVVEVFVQAGEGLAAAHQAGMVHRDFKPENVLIRNDQRVLVSDFGLARTLTGQDEDAAQEPLPPVSPSRERMVGSRDTTVTGFFRGTPAYMAPEQLEGKEINERSDQFAFCVALYEALVGERPFSGVTIEDLRRQFSKGRSRDRDGAKNETGIPRKLRQVLERGLEVDPIHRYQSMTELLVVLRALYRGNARRWIGGGAAAGIVLLVVVLVAVRSRGALCQGAAQKWEGVWGQTIESKIEQSFAATQAAYAAVSFAQVKKNLGQYVEEWQEAYRDTCEATQVRGEQSAEMLDLRMHCLEGVRMEFSALCTLLQQADAKVVESSVRAAQALTPIQSCADTQTLSMQKTPFRDAAQKSQAEALLQEFVQIKVRRNAGKIPEALAMAREAAQKAQEVGHQPTRAQALYWLGNLESHAELYPEAEKDLQEAAKAALETRQHRWLAKSWTSLAQVVGYSLSRPEEGFRWTDLAASAMRLLGEKNDVRTDLETTLGNIHLQNASYEKALNHYQDALAIDIKESGPESHVVAIDYNNMGVTLRNLGRFNEALDNLNRSRQIREKLLGPKHPLLASSYNNLATAYLSYGDTDLALKFQEQALDIFLTVLGPQSPKVAMCYFNLATMYLAQDRMAEALSNQQKAQAIYQKAMGPDHPRTISCHVLLADLYIKSRVFPKAVLLLQQALALQESKFGQNHSNLSGTLFSLGKAFVGMGNPQAAKPQVERCLRIIAAQPGDLCFVARTKFLLAQVNWNLGKKAEALALASDAEKGCGWEGAKNQSYLAEIANWLKNHHLHQ